ncbi:DUF6527 family protein [Nibrella viscosa]|uniref:DUF6527 family protein n=1 Tax=Nibrella viscosa TaxID=1084524 RepID=A0ABP8KZ68_9BACT
MKKRLSVVHEFVELIPKELQEGVVYVSIEYATVVHKCCCGCGSEVVTPLTPTDWSLIFNGCTISLSPSIGNWSFPCQSHYWIKKGGVEWAGQWTQEKIDAGKRKDRQAKRDYFEKSEPEPTNEDLYTLTESQPVIVNIWKKMVSMFKSVFR